MNVSRGALLARITEVEREANNLDDFANEARDELSRSVLRAAVGRLRLTAQRLRGMLA